MKKIIKKLGNSEGIIFTKEEKKIYNIKTGHIIQMKITKKGKKLEEK